MNDIKNDIKARAANDAGGPEFRGRLYDGITDTIGATPQRSFASYAG